MNKAVQCTHESPSGRSIGLELILEFPKIPDSNSQIYWAISKLLKLIFCEIAISIQTNRGVGEKIRRIEPRE